MVTNESLHAPLSVWKEKQKHSNEFVQHGHSGIKLDQAGFLFGKEQTSANRKAFVDVCENRKKQSILDFIIWKMFTLL